MFIGITALGPWLSRLAIEWLPWLGWAAWLVSAAAVLMVSAGLYKLLMARFNAMLRRRRWLRELLLGEFYIEGTWVGCYRRNGKLVYTVEHIDQRRDDPQIQGWAFDQNGVSIGNWTSEVAAIDPKGTDLTYAYRCDMTVPQSQHHGLGKFTLVRELGQAPHTMQGYAADLPDGQKDSNREVKISSLTLPHAEALRLGKEKLRADRSVPRP